MRKHLFLITAAVLITAMAGTSTTFFTNMNVAYAGTLSTTFVPVADSYVYQSSPSTNFGSNISLRLDRSPVTRGYVRFAVQNLSGSITSVTLRLYANSAASAGISVAGVADNTWGESSITYNNAPAIGSVIKVSAKPVAGSWLSVDVSSYVKGNGTYSLALLAGNNTQLGIASRETGAQAPQLVVNTTSAETSVPVSTATSAAPTSTPSATATTVVATSTPSPTPTIVPPTNTPSATATNVPPTNTPSATSTTAVATNTPSATATNVPPTSTPSATATATPGNYQPTFPIRAGFFYPWFPQGWTQSGIFPFTNYHPSLGYYSSTDDATIDAQLNLIAKAHLTAMISSWWGQGHYTDTAFGHILGRSERVGSPYPNLRWSLYYEMESQGNPTSSQIASDLSYLNANYFSQPGYLRVGGKPVIFVYADGTDGCGMVDRWTQAKSQFGGSVFVVLKVFTGYLNCGNQPDSWHQYAPAGAYDVQGSLSAVVSPGFWQIGYAVRLARDINTFTTNVQKMVASNAKWQLVTTWNEWGEGTAVEPATEFGSSYIDALCQNIPGSVSCN